MSVAQMRPMNGFGTIRAVGFWFDDFLFLGTENEKGDQAKDEKRAYNGQNNSRNIHTYNLGVWSLIFKRGVASC